MGNVLKNPFSSGSSLPDYTSADDGKALMVQVDGSVAWELAGGTQTVSSVSGAVSIDLAQGNVVSLALTENVTSVDITGWPEAGEGVVKIYLTQDSPTARSMSWTKSGGGNTVTVWHTKDKNAPNVSLPGESYIIVISSPDGGTNVHGVCTKQMERPDYFFYPGEEDDDGQVNNSGGGDNFGASAGYSLAIGDETGDNYRAWIRFPNVTISQGATIHEARLFLVHSSGTNDYIRAKIKNEQSDNALQPANYNDVVNKTYNTAGEITWYTSSYPDAGDVEISRDIKTLIDDVISRPGWVSGNALFLYITPDNDNLATFKGFAAGELEMPKLWIDWS